MAITTEQGDGMLQVWLEDPTEEDIAALTHQIVADRLCDYGFTFVGSCTTPGCTNPVLINQLQVVQCPVCRQAQVLSLVGNPERALVHAIAEAAKNPELLVA